MKALAAALALLAACAHPLPAADNAALAERTRQTLLYGIDSQVLDVIQSLRAAHDTSFTKELGEILSGDRSAAVRKAVLGLFMDQKAREGEGAARQILAGLAGCPFRPPRGRRTIPCSNWRRGAGGCPVPARGLD